MIWGKGYKIKAAKRSVFGTFAVMMLFSSAVMAEGKLEYKTQAIGPCGTHERWKFSGGIGKLWQQDFTAFLNNKMSPVMAFSRGQELLATSLGSEERLLGGYWVSRAYMEAGLVNLAYRGFNAVISSLEAIGSGKIPETWKII